MSIIKKIVGTNLVRFRQKLQLTQEELAAKSGLSQASIQRIEYGDRFPRAENIEALAKVMNVHVSDFFVNDKNSAENRIESRKESTPKITLAETIKLLSVELQKFEIFIEKIPEDILERLVEKPTPNWNFIRAALGITEVSSSTKTSAARSKS